MPKFRFYGKTVWRKEDELAVGVVDYYIDTSSITLWQDIDNARRKMGIQWPMPHTDITVETPRNPRVKEMGEEQELKRKTVQ